jgi:sarcosine oxidase
LIIAGSSSASARKPGFFNNTVAAARKFGIPHELLSARQMRERFPQFKLGDDEHAYYEPGAGYVRPEECIRAQLELAARAGAELRTNERVRAFHQEGNRVVVETEHTRYTAWQLVVSAGAGAPELLGDGPAALLTVLRQVLFWFEPQRNREQFEPGKFPVFIWNLPGTQDIYGFPMAEGSTGMKIATEQYNVPTTMDTADRTVSPDEITRMYRNHVAPHFPDIGEHCVKTVACLYTATPDSNFIIDRLAGQDRVVVASPCSGHGFKHSAAVGEAIAEIVVDGKSRLDLSRFGFARFAR